MLLLLGCALISNSELEARCDLDGDGADRPGCGSAVYADCDDADPDVQMLTFYADADGDGQGGVTAIQACTAPEGFVDNQGDCDDGDPDVTMLSWYPDRDGDGYGVTAEAVSSCAGVYEYVPDPGDCDDTRDDIHPGARDYCDDGLDNDCDGIVDDLTWYADVDGDSYGDPASLTQTCDPPEGYVSQSGDCDDGNADANPAAPEVCDPDDVDEDCNGASEDSDPAVTGRPEWCYDGDGDGYGSGDSVTQCDAPPGMVPCGDCDEADPGVNPAAADSWYDEVDTNCDGWDDDDADHDGHASATEGRASGDDCDDADAERHPGAIDTPDDGIDQNCNGHDFELQSCLGSAASSTLLAFSYAPSSISGSVGTGCLGASYTIDGFHFYVTAVDLSLGDADQYGARALSGSFSASLNDDGDPFDIALDVLCSEDTCGGYIAPIDGTLSGAIQVSGESLDGDETVVQVTVDTPTVRLVADDSAVHTACAGALSDLVDLLGTTSSDLLSTAVDGSETGVEAEYATDLAAAAEADCRD